MGDTHTHFRNLWVLDIPIYGPKLSQMVPNIPKRSQMVPYMGISKTHKFLKCVCVSRNNLFVRLPARPPGVYMGTYGVYIGYIWVTHVGIYGSIWIYVGTYGYIGVYMGT